MGKMAELFLVTIALVLLTFTSAEYDVKKYCDITQPGTKLPSTDSCQVYYTCGIDGSPTKEYCSDNYVFNKDAQGCVPESEGNCYYGYSNPCQNKHREFSHSNKGCNWYTYCIDGQIASNYTCGVGQRFNAANSSCVNGDCGGSRQQSDVLDPCDVIPSGIYFGDYVNCRAWYQCEGTQMRSGFCGMNGDNDLVLDVISGSCLPNNGNMCQRTKNSVESVASGPPRRDCTGTEDVVADTNVCNLYYTCEPSTPAGTFRWVQKTCKGRYYDVISKSCGGIQTAKTIPTCDRCLYKGGSSGGNYFANAVDPSCEYYFTCKNGHSISAQPRACREGFFNEILQGCESGEENFNLYKENYGACQDYTCNDDLNCSLPATNNQEIPEPNHVSNGTNQVPESGGSKNPNGHPAIDTVNHGTGEGHEEGAPGADPH